MYVLREVGGWFLVPSPRALQWIPRIEPIRCATRTFSLFLDHPTHRFREGDLGACIEPGNDLAPSKRDPGRKHQGNESPCRSRDELCDLFHSSPPRIHGHRPGYSKHGAIPHERTRNSIAAPPAFPSHDTASGPPRERDRPRHVGDRRSMSTIRSRRRHPRRQRSQCTNR